jgi:hypothetical protein
MDKTDLFTLSNGTKLTVDGTEYMKVRTEKDRWGSPTNLELVKLQSDTIKEMRFEGGELFVCDPNPIAFGGNGTDFDSVEIGGTDKELLREYIGQIQRGELS